MKTANKTTLKVISRKIPMQNPCGLHLQPASELSRISLAYDVQVTLQTDNGHADVGSIFELLILGVMEGESMELSAQGHGAADALDAICDFLESYNGTGTMEKLPGRDDFETRAA